MDMRIMPQQTGRMIARRYNGRPLVLQPATRLVQTNAESGRDIGPDVHA